MFPGTAWIPTLVDIGWNDARSQSGKVSAIDQPN